MLDGGNLTDAAARFNYILQVDTGIYSGHIGESALNFYLEQIKLIKILLFVICNLLYFVTIIFCINNIICLYF